MRDVAEDNLVLCNEYLRLLFITKNIKHYTMYKSENDPLLYVVFINVY